MELQSIVIQARIELRIMTTPESSPSSPKWSSNAKLIVGLTLVAIVAILLQQFRVIVGPLILSFVLAFLLHPSATLLNKRVHIPWGIAVLLVFAALIIVLAGVFTLAGFAIVQQIQSLISTIQRFIAQVPQLITDLSRDVIWIGPFSVDLTRFDLTSVTNQLLSSAQSVLGQVGGLVGTVATGTITTLGYARIYPVDGLFHTCPGWAGAGRTLLHRYSRLCGPIFAG